MKRLTKRNNLSGFLPVLMNDRALGPAAFYNQRDYYDYADALEHLAQYEDAEEHGLLVRLPCKVGDTVYYIDGGKSYKAKASALRINASGIRVYCERNFMGLVGFEGIYTKTVFLTREEAETALKGATS